MHSRLRPSLGALLAAAATASGAAITVPHAQVTYDGMDARWARAIAETISAARAVYVDEFAADMPETIVGRLTCKAGEPTRLYTDGDARLFLSVPSEDKLAKPSQSGVFNLYGMCHELGHMAMYRVLKDRDWMTADAAEGWAHYAGSVVTDLVFAGKGESLWPDPYDYRADGTARLNRQLAAQSPDDGTRAAGQWQKLGTIIGQKGFAKLFAAWQAASVDPAKPAEALLAAAVKLFPDKKDALTDWWKTAAPLFTKALEASGHDAATIAPARLTGKPVKLAFDDGTPDGKKSIAGGGHARKFTTPEPGDWYIRAVWVYGARYGTATRPTFDTALCDADLKPIAVWKNPYSRFKAGSFVWTRIQVPPTLVPKDFYVCLSFRPTASQGVFVAFDTSTKGNSFTGTPGSPGQRLAQGDWMIRVELDRPKEATSRKAQ